MMHTVIDYYQARISSGDDNIYHLSQSKFQKHGRELLETPIRAAPAIIIIIIMAGITVFYLSGYLIEERRRWPLITVSPRGQCSK